MSRWISPSDLTARFARAVRRVYGFDFFIAYRRKISGEYARALRDRLAEKPFRKRCFLDRELEEGFRPGRSLDRETERAAKASTALIVLVERSVFAVDSEHVAAEVTRFSEDEKLIVPIDLDGTLQRARDEPDFRTQLATENHSQRMLSELTEVISIDESGTWPRKQPSLQVLKQLNGVLKGISREVFRFRIAAILAFLLLGLSVFGCAISLAERRARQQAESRRLATVAQAEFSDGRLGTALLLAVAALDTSDTSEAQDVLQTALDNDDRLLRILHCHGESVSSLGFDPVGSRLVSADSSGRVLLWKVPDGEVLASLTRPGLASGDVEVSFDDSGNFVAAAATDGSASVWRLPDAMGRTSIQIPPTWHLEAAAESGGRPESGLAIWFGWPRLLVARLASQQLLVHNVETRKVEKRKLQFPQGARVLIRGERASNRLAFSRDGKSLVGAISADSPEAPIPVGLVAVWSTESGAMTAALPNRSIEPVAIATHPDLLWLATDATGPPLRGGATIFRMNEPGKEVPLRHARDESSTVLAPSNQGSRLYSFHGDKEIYIWQVPTAGLAEEASDSPLSGQGGVTAIAEHGSSGLIASGDNRGEVYLWRSASESTNPAEGLDALRSRARGIVNRNFSEGELDLFFPNARKERAFPRLPADHCPESAW